MNLAHMKTSNMPKRKLFEVERAIVRELTDAWCRGNTYYSDDFSENVDISFKGKRIEITFANKQAMRHGSPEATVNEMMRGLIITMAFDPVTGELLKNYEAIIGNIFDVFLHRLKEIEKRKFIFQRLQSLELGFAIAFGMPKEFYPIKHARHILEDVLFDASLSNAEATVETLIHDMSETEALAAREHGVTFHIFMGKKDEANFISLPLGIQQTDYVSLLGTYTLRCNILAELEGKQSIKRGIMKIDAPSDPLSFMHHKGLDLAVNKNDLMAKLATAGDAGAVALTRDELSFIKLLYNEYVQLACFLLSSKKIDPLLRLLVIFPRLNIFSILHRENTAIPTEEPQTLGDLAALDSTLFTIKKAPHRKTRTKPNRISEKIIQEKVFEAIQAFASNINRNIYKPLTDIKRGLLYFSWADYNDAEILKKVKKNCEEMSVYLKKLNRIQHVVITPGGKDVDLETSISGGPPRKRSTAQEEIVRNIQTAEIEQVREIIVSKMLEYLSFLTVRLEQLEKTGSRFIKQEIVREIESRSTAILVQSKAFYKLIMRKNR